MEGDRRDHVAPSRTATVAGMAGHSAVRKEDYVPRLSLFLQSALSFILGQVLVLGMAGVWGS